MSKIQNNRLKIEMSFTHLGEFKARRKERLGMPWFIWFKEGSEEVLGREFMIEFFEL